MEKKEQQNYLIFKDKVETYLEENNMSLRQFAKQVGISCSSLSRIMNGKQKINIGHLRNLEGYIDIHMNDLYTEENNIQEQKTEEINLLEEENEETEDMIKLLEKTYDKDIGSTIQKQYSDCEKLIQTQEGIQIVHREFNEKLESVHGIGNIIDKFKKLYEEFSELVPFTKKWIIIGAVLLYFIMPVDAIPDFMFGIGFLDDIFVLYTCQLILSKMH